MFPLLQLALGLVWASCQGSPQLAQENRSVPKKELIQFKESLT